MAEIIEKTLLYLHANWEKKAGLVVTSTLLVIGYFYCSHSIMDLDDNPKFYLVDIIAIILFAFFTSVFWALQSRRFIIYKTGFTYVGITITGETDLELDTLRRILKKVAESLNESHEALNIRIFVLPNNLCASKNKLTNYFSRFGSQYDLLSRP